VVTLIWRVSPGTVTGVVALTVALAVIPAIQVQWTAIAVQAVADAVTGGGTDRLVRDAVRAGLVIAGLSVAANVLGILQGYLQSLLQLRLANSMSERVLTKAVNLDLRHYENDTYYDSLQRANREAASRPYQLFTDLLGAGELVVGLLSLVTVIVAWDVRLGLFILLSPLPALVANLFFGRKNYEIEHKRAPDRRRVAYLQQLMTSDRAFKEIRLLQLGPLFLDRFRAFIARFYAVDRDLIRRQTLVGVPLSLLSVAVSSTAVIYAMLTTISAGLVGQFTGFVQAIGRIQTSALALVSSISKLYQDSLFIGNLFDFLDLPESTIASGHRPFPARLRHGIEFRDVTFSYPGTGRTALHRLSCFLPAGRCVAVVGANGAGKTTLVKLLTRLYEPTSGQILIDGVPIGEYDLTELRRNIGVIFQDFVQYEMTAQENIGFGWVDGLHDGERVRLAAQQSRAAPFLEALPQGYGTTLGRIFADGHQLSIGQWQKVALARAFMRQAPVVVLDEPTASIDAQAEAEIFGRLREIAHNATALLIAHRFSTVRMADHILVIEAGRLIEQGTHAELVRAGGTYARLFLLQAAGYRDDAEPAPAAGNGNGAGPLAAGDTGNGSGTSGYASVAGNGHLYLSRAAGGDGYVPRHALADGAGHQSRHNGYDLHQDGRHPRHAGVDPLGL
jgi:ATP-binding cassette subfamily B protein